MCRCVRWGNDLVLLELVVDLPEVFPLLLMLLLLLLTPDEVIIVLLHHLRETRQLLGHIPTLAGQSVCRVLVLPQLLEQLVVLPLFQVELYPQVLFFGLPLVSSLVVVPSAALVVFRRVPLTLLVTTKSPPGDVLPDSPQFTQSSKVLL